MGRLRTAILAGLALAATAGGLSTATAAQGAGAPGGPAWSQLQVGTSPAWGVNTALAYDPSTHQVLMFGGEPTVGQLGDFATDETRVWSAAASSWLLLAPAVRPSARESASMAFDSATAQMVLFGGYDPDFGVDLLDTWLWNGSTWTAASTTAQPPAGSKLVFDSATNQLLAFGAGLPWRWTGADWVLLAAGQGLPGGLLGTAFDTANHQLVGLFWSGTGVQTWVWNGAAWLRMVTATSLPSDIAASMVFDQGINQLVLVTKVISSGLAQTWSWRGTDWQQIPTAGPTGALDLDVVFNGAQGQLLLFDVLSGDAGPPNLTWALNVPTTTTLTVSPASPTVGATVTLTARIATSRLLAAVGKVEFFDNAAPVSGCLARGMSKGIATCVTTFAAAGPQVVTAGYLGAAGYQPSTAAVTVSVR